MEQHNQEIGTRRDLVLYRLETARNDLKSARALFSIEDYKGANSCILWYGERTSGCCGSGSGENIRKKQVGEDVL